MMTAAVYDYGDIDSNNLMQPPLPVHNDNDDDNNDDCRNHLFVIGQIFTRRNWRVHGIERNIDWSLDGTGC
jgi:hypothetical protein